MADRLELRAAIDIHKDKKPGSWIKYSWPSKKSTRCRLPRTIAKGPLRKRNRDKVDGGLIGRGRTVMYREIVYNSLSQKA